MASGATPTPIRTAGSAGPAVRLAWYRFRATFHHRWPGYLALTVLIGIVGGVALGSVTAARRTDASYPKFLASTSPSDLVVQPFTKTNYSPGFLRQLARLPHVKGVAATVPLTAATLAPGGSLGTVLLAHVQLTGTLADANGLYFVTVQINGQTVPAMVAPTRPAVGPHILSGPGLDGSHELVLGPATLAQLRQRVGSTVTLVSGSFHVRLKIAGTATMPAIGGMLSVHTSMSTGALFSTAILPGGAASGPFGPALSGPNAILIRLRPGVSQAAGLRSMQAISRQLTGTLNSRRLKAATDGTSAADTVDLPSAQRPAEIVNYRFMGAMPAVLAGGLAVVGDRGDRPGDRRASGRRGRPLDVAGLCRPAVGRPGPRGPGRVDRAGRARRADPGQPRRGAARPCGRPYPGGPAAASGVMAVRETPAEVLRSE